MRIIGGKLKGKSIDFVKSKMTRPLRDSVKESIFNIISHSNLLSVNIKNSSVLDLYSGIGSFGLECISRGAKKITFVEQNKNFGKILNKNLISLKIQDKASIIISKIIDFLETNKTKKFEIIFLDPPFANIEFLKELKLIKEKKIYKNNHIIIIHRERKSYDDFKNILDPLIIKQYGRSKIILGKF